MISHCAYCDLNNVKSRESQYFFKAASAVVFRIWLFLLIVFKNHAVLFRCLTSFDGESLSRI